MTWLGLIAAAAVYSHRSPPFSHWIMTGVLPAFLFESIFFLGAGFESTRAVFSRFSPPWIQSLALWVSSLVPYLLVSLTASTFESHSFVLLCVVSALVSFWWVIVPRRLALDIAFLAIAAAVIVVRLFSWLYVSPLPHFELSILGHLMWIRLTLMVLLVQRGFQVRGVGFWPRLREWREGVLQFLIAILPLSAIAIALRFATFSPRRFEVWEWTGLAAGYFLGFLWVVAFSEDIFRSVITQLFLDRGQAAITAVAGSAVLVGCAHLWYKDFPNWRFAAVATVAHLFYTIAYIRARSVRASMVTHALTVTAWRMLFRA
ncbi:MAG: CPBP family glutamic-type intramembrane protease [Bryobacteraceae bacterium]